MSAARWMLRDSDRGSLLVKPLSLMLHARPRKEPREGGTSTQNVDFVMAGPVLAIPLRHATRSPRPEEARSAVSKDGPRARAVPAAHGSRRALLTMRGSRRGSIRRL